MSASLRPLSGDWGQREETAGMMGQWEEVSQGGWAHCHPHEASQHSPPKSAEASSVGGGVEQTWPHPSSITLSSTLALARPRDVAPLDRIQT